MPNNLNAIFEEVRSNIRQVEHEFLARDYQIPFVAFVDHATWRCFGKYVTSNGVGSVVNDGISNYIQYQNWKIFAQAELKHEMRMFPGNGIHMQLINE
jgi:hypothetical protein